VRKIFVSKFCGFTLLETLVALAVVTIALAALWKGLSQGQYISQQLPDRILARWVAQNRIVTRQVMGEWPDTRSYTGTQEMGGRDWYWQEQVIATDVNSMRRIVVSVGLSSDSKLFTLEGYIKRTQPPIPYERLFQ
jgi:general secretion pathway protein I